MLKRLKRTPKNYDQVDPTNKQVSCLLQEWMAKASRNFQDRPDLILLSWPDIIGEKLAPMTTALSFVEGVLTVRVRNSSLYSLLVQHERNRLLSVLQQKFPSVKIRNIVFRLG